MCLEKMKEWHDVRNEIHKKILQVETSSYMYIYARFSRQSNSGIILLEMLYSTYTVASLLGLSDCLLQNNVKTYFKTMQRTIQN